MTSSSSMLVIAQESAIPKITALTGLRGIAAWLVVLYHIRLSLTGLLPDAVIDVFAKGYLAVDLFFMLSGFVMWLNYGSYFAKAGLRGTPQFLWKRLARIWPLHVLVLSAMTALFLLQWVRERSAANYPLTELPLHIALMQNWGMTGALSWNHPAWSISTEFAAYILFPLLVCVFRWDLLGKTALCVILALLVLTLNTYFSELGYNSLGEDIPRTGLLRCVIEFSAGIILAALWQRTGQGCVQALVWAGVAIVTAAAALIFSIAETLIAPMFIAAFLMMCASDRGLISRALSGRTLLWLGNISYAIYLTHFFLFILFKIIFIDQTLQIGWGQLAMFLLLVLTVSALAYHFFEMPAQRWINGRAPRFAR